MTRNSRQPLTCLVLVGAVISACGLSACAPLVFGGAMLGSAMVVTDRRTSGTQIEDQAIELKAANRIRDEIGERGRVNVTSYNRLVLITGEVQNEADKATVERAASRVENLRSIVNEVAVLGASSLTSRSNDLVLASKVKATLFDAKDLMANAFKVVADRGIVYLMGRVTEREATRATNLARSISGVQKVVRVFEVITEAELANSQPAPPAK